MMFRLPVYRQWQTRLSQFSMHRVEILLDRLSCWAIETFHKSINQGINILFWIPEKFREHVCAKLGKFPTLLPVALKEHTGGMVRTVVVDVGLKIGRASCRE